MTAHAKAPTTDEINEMLCTRNDQLEAEKAALAEQLERAETDRDEWKAQADGEAMVCSGYRDELDALKAHVERIVEWWGDESKTKLDLSEFAAIIADCPTTSLARLKAQWQAEALESLLHEGRHSYYAETVRAFIRNRLNRLRRQAEEAS